MEVCNGSKRPDVSEIDGGRNGEEPTETDGGGGGADAGDGRHARGGESWESFEERG